MYNGKYLCNRIDTSRRISVKEYFVLNLNFHYILNNCTFKFTGTKADEVWNGQFFFVVGSDPQFGMMDFQTNPDYNPQKADWTEEIRLAKLAVEKVNQLNPKPKFFVICGDLTNEFPGDGM